MALPETMKVLITDDDPPTRILLRAAISQWDYQIVEAKNGEEAWEILQQPNAPRLLILDWLMPNLSGIDLCKRIRQELVATYNPYIILLTQVSGTENIIKGLDAGANEFLSKPFNMAELRSRLSIGKKIINYENIIEKISLLALTSSQKLTNIIKDTNSSEIKEVAVNLEEMIILCNHFQPEKNKKG